MLSNYAWIAFLGCKSRDSCIDEFAKSNPKVEGTFKQDREAGLQALSAFIADLEKSDCLNIL
jgi:hypothetical protein